MHLVSDNPAIRWQKAQILAKVDAEFPLPSVNNKQRTVSPSVPAVSNSRPLIVKKIVPVTHVHSSFHDSHATVQVSKISNHKPSSSTSTTELQKNDRSVSKELDRLNHLHFQQRNEISILKEELKSKLKQQQSLITRDQIEREWLQTDRQANIPPIPRSLNVLKPRRNNVHDVPVIIEELLRKRNIQQQKPAFAMSSLQKKQEYDSSISDIRAKDTRLSDKIQQFLARRLASIPQSKQKIKRSPSYSSTFESNANVLKSSSSQQMSKSRSTASQDRLSRSLHSSESSAVRSDYKFSASVDGHLATIDDTAESELDEIPKTRKLKSRGPPSDENIKPCRPRPVITADKTPSISSTVINSSSIVVDESISLAETLNSSNGSMQNSEAAVPKITITSDAQTSTSKILSDQQPIKPSSLGSLQTLRVPKVQISNFNAFKQVYENVEAMICEQEEIFNRINNTKLTPPPSKPASIGSLSKMNMSTARLNTTSSKTNLKAASLPKVDLKVSKDPIAPIAAPQSSKQDLAKQKLNETLTLENMMNDVGVQDIDVFLKKYGNMLLTSYSDDLAQIADEIAGQLIGAELLSH